MKLSRSVGSLPLKMGSLGRVTVGSSSGYWARNEPKPRAVLVNLGQSDVGDLIHEEYNARHDCEQREQHADGRTTRGHLHATRNQIES